MARFSIISKDGNKIRYEGKPRYIGTYLKPSYLEFSEIASPTPIDWQIGDYIDYPRTGMRYRLYSIPQASKNARKGSHGRAFTYSNVQLHAATKELEIALFKDLVSTDNNIHFSTSPDVATFEDVYGIARRIQACMDDLYPNRWVIEVADFNAVEDAEMLENITTAKDFALSGGTCLDALTKIYELWQEVGWIHTYDSASGKDVITIGYANKRIGANTTDAYIYGKGNGLTAIKKTQANKDEFATRLYVYGSDRNLPSRYYNGKYILNAESVDIRNLMIPIGQWKTTGGVPDARKAYIENAEAVAKYGIIPKTHYFDSDDAGADIYPTIEGITIGQVRRLQADYKPSTSIYPNDEERIDEVKSVVNPNDDGVIRPLGKAYKYYKIANVEAQKSEITLTDSTVVKVNKILLLTDLEGEGKVDMTVIPDIGFALDDAGFTEVNATFELTDSPTKTKRISKISAVVAKRNGTTGRWEFKAPRISVDYDYASTGSIPVSYVLTLEATLSEKREGETIAFDIEQGEIEVGANALLDKEFTITLKQIGFNIEERASVGSGKTISMKTGDNEGRNFVIKECRYEGSSDSWVLTCRRQQDNNLGMLFPNNDYQIKGGDRFVLLDIAMPELYVAAAMERLLAEGQKLLSKVSRIQNNYEPSIDAKVMAESGRTIREGMFMQIADEDIIDGATEYILIDTINIYEDEAAIPTYKVTLKEKKKVSYKGTPSATTTSNTSSVEEKTDIDLSGYVTKEKFAAIEFLKDLFYKYDDTTYGTKYNLFSEGEMSANGLNLGGGTSGGGGLIQNVLGKSAFGTVASEDNATTFNAFAIDSLYKRIVELEGKDVEVDLSDYYTKQQTQNAITSALSPYIKATDADGKYAALASFNALQSSFDRLYSALNDDTSGVINTWNEVVDFVNEYSGSEDLSTILGKMNTDINARVKVSDFESWKTDVFNPLSVTVTNLGNKVNDHTDKINKILSWFELREDEDLLITTHNLASYKEISANGISQGTGGGGSGLISSVLGATSLGATLANDNSVVFNAYATNEIYKATQGHASRIGVLESQVGQLTTQGTKVSVSDLLTTGTKIATITVDGVAHEVKGDFLPTSGGTMSGQITITSGSDRKIIFNNIDDDTNWNYISFRQRNVEYGVLGTAGDDNLVWNRQVLLHSGNVGEYALKTDGSNKMSKGVLFSDRTLTEALSTRGTGIEMFKLSAGGSLSPTGSVYFSVLHAVSSYAGLQLAVYGGSSDNSLYYRKISEHNTWTDWKQLAFTDSNVASATKLQAARTIWGQSFDGTGNVSGTLSLGNGAIHGGASSVNMLYYDPSNTLYLGYGMCGVGGSVICGNAIAMRYGSSRVMGFLLNSSGGVTIGGSDLAGTSAKLLVDGDVALRLDVYGGSGNVVYRSLSFLGSVEKRGGLIRCGINDVYSHFHSLEFGSYDNPTMMLINSSGNVTIGASDKAGTNAKLYVDGKTITKFVESNEYGVGNVSWGLDSSSQGLALLALTGNVYMPLGNVLIGTTTDSGEKLQVNGGIRSLTGSSYLYGYATSTATNISELDNATAIGAGKDYWNIYMWSFGSGKGCIQSCHSNGTTVYDLLLQPFGGNVLIGTTTDSGTKLYVSGDVRFDGQTRINGSMRFYGKTNLSSDMYIDNQSVGGFNFAWSNGNSRFFIGNNVGIGTTNPQYKLDVNGTLRATNAATFGSTLTIAGDAYIANGKSLILAKDAEGIYLTNYVLCWHDASNAWTKTLMTFNSSGNVGIGSTSPAYKLDVNGANEVLNLSNSSGGAIGIRFSRGTNTSWSIVDEGGNLKFKENTSARTLAIFYESSQGAKFALGGGLEVTDASRFSGMAYFGGTTYYINTSGNANFNAISGDSLSVTTLTVSGASSFASKTTHNGGIGAAWVSISGTFEVGTTSTFAGKTTHNGGIKATDIETASFLATGSAKIYGELRLQNGSNANGNYLYFGDESFCYLHEENDDRLTIYAQKGLVTKAATGTAWDSITKENWIDDNSAHTRFVNNYNALAIIIDKDYGTSYRRAAIQVGDTSNNVGTLYLNPKGGEVHVGSTLYVSTINAGSTLYLQASTITNIARWWTLSATGDFYTLGNIAAEGEISANALNQGSDIRFKHQLGDITLDLDTIANAPMFRFTWTNKENSRVQIGTSAQYWKDSARELVSVDKDDFHRLDYATLGVLIGVTLGKTVKNHEDRIKELEMKVESLEAENRRLRYEHC